LPGKNLIMSPNSGKNLVFSLKPFQLISVFICLLLPSFGVAQIDIQRYTTATDTFYWKRYIHIAKPPRVNLKRFSASGSTRKKEAFLVKYPREFPQFTNDLTHRHSVKELKKCLFPIDINGDDLTDMIFSGTDGDGSEIVRIWLNRRDSFDLIFEDYQYISKFIRSAHQLEELQTGDAGTGKDYLYFTRDYRIGYEKSEPVFIKGKQTVLYKYTEEPTKYYLQPIPFVSKADTLLVRASSAQLNEPFLPYLDTFGNIVAKFRTHSSGVVLAEKLTGKGNNWFFVEFSPATSPSASILYGVDKIPTFIRGWVSAQAILLK
jgi:hypothetical protein